MRYGFSGILVGNWLSKVFGVLKRFGYGVFLREALNEWTLKFGSELSRYAVTSLMPW